MTADAAEKGASERPEESIPINHSNCRSIIKNGVVGKWNQWWETCRDKLWEIKPEPEIWIDIWKYSPVDEVIISRMRLGHTLLTHGYLVDNDVPPHCKFCNNASLSVKHIMMECEQLMDARQACL